MAAEETVATALANLLSQINIPKESPKLPIFSGRDAKSKECTFAEWIYLFEKRIDDDGGLSRDAKERIMLHSLSGEARSRYIQLERGGLSFREIISRFKQIYGDHSSAVELIENFHSLRQNEKETVTEFADRVERTAHEVAAHEGVDGSFYKSDEILKTKFIRGLKDQELIGKVNHILDDEMRSFDYLRTRMLNEESRRNSSKISTKPTKVVTEEKDNVSEVLKEALRRLDEQAKEITELKTELKKEQESKWSRKQCDYYGKMGHLRKDCYALKKRESAQKPIRTGN